MSPDRGTDAGVPARRRPLFLSRRQVVGGLLFAAPVVLLACSDEDGSVIRSGAEPDQTPPTTRPAPLSEDTMVIAYGNGPNRYGHLDVPTRPAPADGWPVAVLIHGGFWRRGYGIDLMFGLAQSLKEDGWATWNIQYSSSGDDEGGWPGTFEDVATAIDHLQSVDEASLDLARVVAIGHSAGGHLALWAASRPGQSADAPGAAPKVAVAAAVSQAGVTDLLRCDADDLGAGACRELMGVAPRRDLVRYLMGSPIEQLPTGTPTILVHGDVDATVPVEQSRSFHARATESGDESTLLVIEGADHFAPIDPAHPAWQRVRPRLSGLVD